MLVVHFIWIFCTVGHNFWTSYYGLGPFKSKSLGRHSRSKPALVCHGKRHVSIRQHHEGVTTISTRLSSCTIRKEEHVTHEISICTIVQ